MNDPQNTAQTQSRNSQGVAATRQLPDTETMYRAFEQRDSQFDGIFFTAVRTTGIFCRSTCPARKPKRENVEFFATVKEALDYGYRPCKRCRPLETAATAPAWVAELIDAATESSAPRLRDEDLRRRGIDPAAVRRWFKRHHGMTYHAFARQLRINRAYGAIRNGDGSTVTDQAFESGYESLAGFGDAFRRTTGFSPSESTSRSIITITRIATPLGPMIAGAVDDRLCLLEFADRPMLETQLHRVTRIFGSDTVAGVSPLFEALERQLGQYFEGSRIEFDLPLDMTGTEFQMQVWTELLSIPYGETRSYQDQAAALGKPRAVRAVGRANGDNRIAIVVPCHRVVGSDGKLTGYGGGLFRKRYLIDLEQTHLEQTHLE